MAITLAEPDEEARTRKLTRYRLSWWRRSNSSMAGAKTCMTAAAGASHVRVSRTAGGAVFVDGVRRCASPWACPVCAPVIWERRAVEVQLGLAVLQALGYRLHFVTATASHKLGDHLSDVFALVGKSWSGTWSGSGADRWRKSTGFVGSIRRIEVTYGANGWHPHVHAVLVFAPDSKVTDADLDSMGGRFADEVAKRGGQCLVGPQLSPGWNHSPITDSNDVAAYVTKIEGGWSPALELTRSDLKTARRSGVKPFDLLELAAGGDATAETLWRIYETTTAGRRAIRWSAGLKALARVDEQTDEEAASADLDGEIVAEWRIPRGEWNQWVRTNQLGRALIWFATAVPLQLTG